MARVLKLSHWSSSTVVDLKLNLGLVNEDVPGLSRLLSSLWKWSRGVMEVEKMGASVSFIGSWDHLTVAFKAPRDIAERALGRLWDALTKVDVSMMDKAISEASAQVNVARESTGVRAFAEALRGLMPDSPYGNHPEALLGVDLRSIRPEDVKRAVDNLAYFSATVVGGDIELPGSPANAKWPTPKLAQSGEVEVKLSDKVQDTVVKVYAVDSIYGRTFNFMAFNTLLGGMGLISRLYQEIRVKRGLAYYAYSTYIPLGGVGILAAFVGTRRENVGEVKSLIDGVVASMSNVGQGDVEMVRGNQRGRLVVRSESPEGIAQMYSIIPLYGLPDDYYDRYVRFLDELRPQDIAGMVGELKHSYAAVAGP